MESGASAHAQKGFLPYLCISDFVFPFWEAFSTADDLILTKDALFLP